MIANIRRIVYNCHCSNSRFIEISIIISGVTRASLYANESYQWCRLHARFSNHNRPHIHSIAQEVRLTQQLRQIVELWVRGSVRETKVGRQQQVGTQQRIFTTTTKKMKGKIVNIPANWRDCLDFPQSLDIQCYAVDHIGCNINIAFEVMLENVKKQIMLQYVRI